MGDKVLARAFELAERAVEAENQSQVPKAKELFTAAIDAFKAVLSMPGFIQDAATRSLIEKEVEGLKTRKAELISRSNQHSQLEQRMEKLKDPNDMGHLQDRFNRLKGNDPSKPVPTLEEINQRLKALQSGGDENTGATASADIAKLPKDNPFAGDDWKKGLDPELLDIIQKARDEASLM